MKASGLRVRTSQRVARTPLRPLAGRLGEESGRAGFSLLELTVALGVTSLLAGAIMSIVVATAQAGARQYADFRARAAAAVATAAVAAEIRSAGHGFESASAIQLDAQRIPIVGAIGGDRVSLLRASGSALEIVDTPAGFGYRLEVATNLEVGGSVAGVGQPARPHGAPLPAGRVSGIAPQASGFVVRVAWAATESALIDAWGEPRALLPFEVREFGVRERVDGRELRRRSNSKAWQPVVGGLRSFEIGVSSACLAKVTAATTTAGGRVVTSKEWVRLDACR